MSTTTMDLSEMLMPIVVDHIAETDPNAIWLEYPKSPQNYNSGYEAVTFAQFANAANGIAHLLQKTLGRKETIEPLAYLAPNDARTGITILGAIKAGYAAFLTSDRNSVAAHLSLFDDLNCRVILTTDPPVPAVEAILAERNVRLVSIPPLEELLSTTYPKFSFGKTLDTSSDDVALVVHTSGSTGFPQPRLIRHGYIARAARNIRLEAPKGFQMLSTMIGNNRNALLLPLAHPAGIHFGLFNPLFNKSTIVIPLPSVPPTGQTLAEMLKHTTAEWATTAPLTLETISKYPALLDDIVPKLKMVLYSGGSLPKVFGDVLAPKIKLATLLGSSESGPLPTMYRHDFDFVNDWNYIQMHPAVGPAFEMQRSHVYELVLKRSPESDPYQTVFTIFPELKEYRTKDLFTPHPTRPDVWTHASRSDDVIVFISGEKINPVTYESHVAKNPEVATVLMFGNQRFEAGLLIELTDKKEMSAPERAKILDRLWPTIDNANAIAPGYAKVSKSHIRFTDPDKPIMRTAKNTVRRQVTLELYAPQIERLYADVEAAWDVSESLPNFDWDDSDSLKSLIRGFMEKQLKGIDDETDFFARGIDSLGVLRLVRYLKQEIGMQDIQPSMIYLNPSIASLARAIQETTKKIQTTDAEKRAAREQDISNTLQTLCEDIDKLADMEVSVHRNGVLLNRGEKQIVILTGSTGSIGSYILKALMNSPMVERIYCLNRSDDSHALQKERNAKVDPSLPQEFPSDRVVFMKADFSDSQTLGLQKTDYESLQRNATLIIHNAWHVDFNLPLSSFAPQLAGVVNLISLSATSNLKPPILFLSSISAVMNSSRTTPVPEAISTDLSAPVSGYGESKYIAERLLSYAAEKLDVRTGVARIGQICGSSGSTGRWNASEWIPSLILSSRYLGMIPDSLIGGTSAGRGAKDDIDWLPINILSETLLDFAFSLAKSQQKPQVQVYQPMNPNRTSWEALLPSILKNLVSSKAESHEFNIVKPKEWLENLRKSGADMAEKDVKHNPAVKLIDFFGFRFGSGEGGADLEWQTKKAVEASVNLRSAKKVDEELMGRWVREWCEEI